MGTVWHEDGRQAPLPSADLRSAAEGMLVARRAMRGSLPTSLVHDVALEMLLELFLAEPDAVDVGELLADQTLPSASAERWLAAVAAEDLVGIDGGRAALTPLGRSTMTDMLNRVVSSQRTLLGWGGN